MTITPYLYYENVDAALQWLAKAFGFKPYGKKMTASDGTVNHAAMRYRDGIIMMGAPGARYKNPRRLGQTTQSIYVMVDNADRQFQRATKAGGGKILEQPVDTEYGHRRCGVADPEGHEWYFAHELKIRPRKRGQSRSTK